MLILRAIIPVSIVTLLKRLGIILCCFQVARLLFYFSNRVSFPSLLFTDFFASLWFDTITICLISILFSFFSLLPFSFTANKYYQWFLKILFHFINTITLSLNLMDVVYFNYSNKRSAMELVDILQGTNDLQQQFFSLVRDFWWLLIILLLLSFLSNYLYNKTKYVIAPFTYLNFNSGLKHVSTFLISLLSLIILGRGGFQLKPLGPLDASKFTRVENCALILNTPFTLLKSFNKVLLQQKKYFSEKEVLQLFNPIIKTNPQHLLPKNTNVVIIILESFGNEWIGAAGAKNSFTPFLDSLATKSLYFENGIANGKKSIEAASAVIASVPSLLDNPYISSPYSNNSIYPLPKILAEQGYRSAFFHAGTNGSMKFDAFAAQAGFDDYFGRTEYNNDDHFDGTWGILDEYFNPWTAKQLSTFSTPFFATLFTSTSHHPYFIPEHLRGKLKKGPEQICESLAYGDYSLRKFFEEAKKQEWFSNTLFVLCADHASLSNSAIYSQPTEIYKIPILFYHPSGTIVPKTENEIFQQLDIMPTVLELLNIEKEIYSFGKSYFQKTEREAFNYLEGTYYYFNSQHLISFSNDKTKNLYNTSVKRKNNPDSLFYLKEKSKQYEKKLKAVIQRYNHDMILNQTKPQ